MLTESLPVSPTFPITVVGDFGTTFCHREPHMKNVVERLPTNMQVHVRWMICRDMPSVVAIDEHGLRWDKETFIRHLRQHHTIGMVAEWREQVIGQVIYELHKNRLHIVNFGVDPEYRRRTVASQMIEKLRSKLSIQRRNRITLCVPETALGMQLFLKRCGFRAVGIDEDDYRFVLRHVAEVSR